MKKLNLICIWVCMTVSMSAQIYVIPSDTIKKYQYRQSTQGVGLNFSDYVRAQIEYQLSRGIPVTGTSTISTNSLYRQDSATVEFNKVIRGLWNKTRPVVFYDSLSEIDLQGANAYLNAINGGVGGVRSDVQAFNQDYDHRMDGTTSSIFKDRANSKTITYYDSLTSVRVSSLATDTTSVTYSYVTSAGTNTITAGAKMISVCNTGGASATFSGGTLPAGACVTLPICVGIVRPQITYDCLTSSLTIIVER